MNKTYLASQFEIIDLLTTGFHKFLMSNFLFQVKLKSKPYDPKKSCWVPEKSTGGYLEGIIESIDGEKVSVKLNVSKEVSWFCFSERSIYLLIIQLYLHSNIDIFKCFSKFSSNLANSAQDVWWRRNPETCRNVVFLRKYTIILFWRMKNSSIKSCLYLKTSFLD